MIMTFDTNVFSHVGTVDFLITVRRKDECMTTRQRSFCDLWDVALLYYQSGYADLNLSFLLHLRMINANTAGIINSSASVM